MDFLILLIGLQNSEYFLLLYLCETDNYIYLVVIERRKGHPIHVIVLAQWQTHKELNECAFVIKFDNGSKTEWILYEGFLEINLIS